MLSLLCGCSPETSPAPAPAEAWDIVLGSHPLPAARCQISFSDPPDPLAHTLTLEADETYLSADAPVRINTNVLHAFQLKGKSWEMSHPIIDLDVHLNSSSAATSAVRLLVIELKDRIFHPANQAEVRRSEARKWATHLRGLDTNQTILVMGDLYDDPDGAVLRTLYDIGYAAVPAADDRGQRWTHVDEEVDAYHRWRYLLMPVSQTNRVETSLDPHTRALRVRLRP